MPKWLLDFRAVVKTRQAGCLVAAVVLLIGSHPAIHAAALPTERILSFDSRITVNNDASMLVTETIRVLSTGEQIRRGIFRDFPTTYKDRAGNRYTVGFTVQSILRNGQPEDWHTETLPNGVRVYMGRKDHFLKPGEHTYTLSYATDRQLGFFADHDELYWNVTGNGWAFRIDAASATVELPPGAPGAILLEAYTGPAGATGNNYSAEMLSTGTARFKTTRSLAPNEGLTIVVGWPKRFVQEPSTTEKTAYFLKDNLTFLVATIGLIVVLAYYLLVWAAVGKDPAKGIVMPLYAPPDNLSPAAIRFMAEMDYDDKVFAAAVIDMAVKGHLTISDSDSKYTLVKRKDASAKLSPDEQRVMAQLFRSATSIVLERSNHAAIAAAKNALKTSLALAFEKSHFLNNRRAFVSGVIISVAAAAAAFLSALDQGEVLFLGIWLTVWSIGVIFLAAMVIKLWLNVFSSVRSLDTRVGSLGAAVFLTLFSMPFFGAEAFALYMLAQSSPALAVLPLIMGTVNILFYHLLKAPTLLGRRVLDRIEGFKMFLCATEKDRLQRLAPADRTPETYEKYLPYALALNVEQQWTEQFSDVLAAASRPGGAEGYHPRWYSGKTWDSSRMGSFAGSVGSSLSSAISASSTAPGSRSGGGGGGSSGGGGGGGGGGAW
jgi:uncharacterized membrane protein YgcG